jgi:hypothetical protein
MAQEMIMRLPKVPYPPVQNGYWSPVTSTLNWCEEVSAGTHITTIIISLDTLKIRNRQDSHTMDLT